MKQQLVLLLLYKHSSHTENISEIDIARENGIAMCLPPHCTHKMRHLDIALMGSLFNYYRREVKTWLRNNSGRFIIQLQIAMIFGVAYAQVATLKIESSAFKKTGMYPTNSNVFGDAYFLASESTQRPIT
jgi:hypothetical protein